MDSRPITGASIPVTLQPRLAVGPDGAAVKPPRQALCSAFASDGQRHQIVSQRQGSLPSPSPPFSFFLCAGSEVSQSYGLPQFQEHKVDGTCSRGPESSQTAHSPLVCDTRCTHLRQGARTRGQGDGQTFFFLPWNKPPAKLRLKAFHSNSVIPRQTGQKKGGVASPIIIIGKMLSNFEDAENAISLLLAPRLPGPKLCNNLAGHQISSPHHSNENILTLHPLSLHTSIRLEKEKKKG